MKTNGTPIFGEWDSCFLAGNPTFYKKGVPDSYFQSPSENPEYDLAICEVSWICSLWFRRYEPDMKKA